MHAPALHPVGEELLDDPAADPAAVAASLRDIARANRWFGGRAAVTWGLAATLGDLPRGTRLTLLDLGTGLGDLPRAAVAWGARRGLAIRPLALERSPVAARLARDAGVPCALGCIGALPFAARCADVVLVSQLAHHLAPGSVVRLLRECDRVARRAVVVADLRRSGAARFWFRIGARLLRFDPVTRHDGLLSIRRGFTPGELRALTRQAGVTARVARRPGWRGVAAWRPAAAGDKAHEADDMRRTA